MHTKPSGQGKWGGGGWNDLSKYGLYHNRGNLATAGGWVVMHACENVMLKLHLKERTLHKQMGVFVCEQLQHTCVFVENFHTTAGQK